MWYKVGMIWLLLGSVFGMLFTLDLSEGRISGLLFAILAICLSIGGAILYGVAHTGHEPGRREERESAHPTAM
jgi:hypothetical protein